MLITDPEAGPITCFKNIRPESDSLFWNENT